MNPNNPRSRPIPTGKPRDNSLQQAAAAEVIRGQINSIYNKDSSLHQPQQTADPGPATTTPQTTQVNPPTTTLTPQATPARPAATTTPQVDQPQISAQPQSHGLRTSPPTQAANPINTQQIQHRGPQATPEQWKQFHSAWQKYYQLYYERYYANHLSAQQALLAQKSAETTQAPAAIATDEPDEETPEQAAIKELRQKIRNTVQSSTKKVKKSRHFVPVMAGLVVMAMFLFLQYNRVIFGAVAAYASPGNIDPQNIIVDSSVDNKVSPEPRLIIPKINVDAPVVYGTAPDEKSQLAAMEKGVAHFAVSGASAVPGQYGNTVLAAHSSNDAFASGDYKFIFAQNEKLQEGDIIYVNYEGTRYTYKVTSMEVVLPTEVNKIQIGTDKPYLTLISCVPLGTAAKRLLVFAEQISPTPSSETTSPSVSSDSASADIPGKPSPTLLERLFGS